MGKTIRATGREFEVGGSTVTLDTDGKLQVTSPGGFGGIPKTDHVAGTVFGIERVKFDENGDPVRQITLFEVV